MKKMLLAMLLLIVFALPAQADTAINGGEERGIVCSEAVMPARMPGISPTTGRVLADLTAPREYAGLAVTGRYMPMLVQIDNAEGGINTRAPWNLSFADIIYETPLYLLSKETHAVETRISALFSDLIPEEVGPLRSARIGHAAIREEWDCGFLFYGQQEYEGTNVLEYFSSTGADQKGMLFNGISGASYKQYMYERFGLAAPHNKGANLAALVRLIPEDRQAAEHALLFSEEAPLGDPATDVLICWNSSEYDSRLIYSEETGLYTRYMTDGRTLTPYTDYNTRKAITFSNVIVQWIHLDWPRVDAPVADMLGGGNADMFIGGVHVAGCWKREGTADRTVFYGADGQQMAFHPGTTLIITMPLEHTVSYQ